MISKIRKMWRRFIVWKAYKRWPYNNGIARRGARRFVQHISENRKASQKLQEKIEGFKK